MKEKNSNKITFGTYAVLVIIFALVLLVGILGGMLLQKNKENKKLQEDNIISTNSVEKKEGNIVSLNEIENESEKDKEIKVGEYVLQGMEVDPENWGVYSIRIKENNKFTVESSYASSYRGKYEIKENTLNCNATEEFNGEDGYGGSSANGQKKVNKTFEFEILNDNDLKFTKVSDKLLNLTIGKTYSLNVKNEAKETVKGEKLIQFENKFFELKKIAKEYRLCDNIKNYKDFNYDLDGDGVKDKITIRRKKYGESSRGDEYLNVFELNGKKFFEDSFNLCEIYIVDLNKNDNKIEVVISDGGPSDDPEYAIFTKKGNKMVQIKSIDGEPLKTDKQGNFVVGNWLDGSIEPGIYFNYYYIKDGKVQSKKTDISKVKNIDCKSPYMYFTEDIKNLTKFENEFNIREENELKKFNIEKLNNKTFKIINFKEMTEKEWEKDSIPYKLYVQLSDGRKGYVFHIQWAG